MQYMAEQSGRARAVAVRSGWRLRVGKPAQQASLAAAYLHGVRPVSVPVRCSARASCWLGAGSRTIPALRVRYTVAHLVLKCR